MMVKNIIKKIGLRIRRRFVLSYLFENLAKIGIKIDPYYLTLRIICEETPLNLKPGLNLVIGKILSPSEIELVYSHPENKWFGSEKRKHVQEGCLCYGLKYNGEITAFTWCNLYRCHEIYPFNLKNDEAYITETYTFEAYRGKNLAPFLKYQFNQYLMKAGRKKVYGFINVFNSPAIRYMKKINAIPIKIIFCVRLFDKFSWQLIMASPKRFVMPF